MKVKVCGLTNPENIKELVNLNIDMIGFIFYKPSSRYIQQYIDFDFVRSIPGHIKKVGVFVNETTYNILNAVAHYNLDMVQLHGEESIEQCQELKPYVNIIKAFAVNEQFNFNTTKTYENAVDYFLFDTKTMHYGGSGKQFNWQLLSLYVGNKPFLLSGGIHEKSVNEIIAINHPQLYGIDINSKFEITAGIKNIKQIQTFINQLHHANTI